MKLKRLFNIILVLVLAFSFSVPCFASASGGRGTIFNNNDLNARAINAFNSMSTEERQEYIGQLFPVVLGKLGFSYNGVSSSGFGLNYDAINAFWKTRKQGIISFGGTGANISAVEAYDFYSGTYSPAYLDMFIYHPAGSDTYRYYDELSEYLAYHMFSSDSNLNTDSFETTQNIVSITNDFIEDKIGEFGVQDVLLGSYYGISPSFWNNNTIYSNLNTLVSKHLDSKYVVLYCTKVPYSSSYQYWAVFPKVSSKLSLYMSSPSGASPLTNLYFCDSNGVQRTIFSNPSYYDIYKLNGTEWSTNNIYNGNWGSRFDNGMRNYVGNPAIASEPCIYTLNRDSTTYTVFNSLSSWNNNHGEWNNPYVISPISTSIPSISISPSDLSNYYNANFNPNNVNNNDININVQYPSNFDNYTDNNYDPDSKTLSFNGISSLLSSLGNLIGSLINGIASGLANIIESIVSVVQNLITFFTNGIIFEFLKAFLSWLPDPLPTLLGALFTLAVIFAVVKLVKGAFS